MRFLRDRGRRAGFTLLEVLVALAVMAIAGTLILQLFAANLRSISVSADVTAASARADARLRELLADVRPAERTWTETTDDGYRMDVSMAETLAERTEGLPVRMMEVSLTIRWTAGGRERSLELKSMKLVDRMLQEDRV
jgi:prepilin-type N-terminal cleavage/methylation domain-containing protein